MVPRYFVRVLLAILPLAACGRSAFYGGKAEVTVNPRIAPERFKVVAVIAGERGVASRSVTEKRKSSGSRRTNVASTVPGWAYCPVSTGRVSIAPPTVART